jgi:glycine cleavage system regulatory protein
MTTSLVVTVIGADRPGIVNLLSDAALHVGANWTKSRMASLAGQFAGIVHFEVADRAADALARALSDLASSGLQIVIAKGDTVRIPGARRRVSLDLVGHDRQGIVRELSGSLARRGVSIEELHTEVASAAMSAERLFRMHALLQVPELLTDGELRRGLEDLANELMVDIEVEVPASGAGPGGR